jgi:phosphatidate cytidylyltransferase
MFKQRLLTALILVPLVLLALYYSRLIFLQIGLVIISLAMGIEWLQLIPIKRTVNQCLFVLVLAGFVVLSLIGLDPYWTQIWLVVGLVLWGFILLAVVTFPVSQTYWGYSFVIGGACFILVPLFAKAFNLIYSQAQGQDLVVYLLLIVWATDIGAYLAGKQWGRHKLIPNVSPGKTIEGAAGGIILAILVAILGYIYFKPGHVGRWFAVTLATILIAMLGDLFISMLKRRSHIKDTGAIFPGHGGVLDRLDSLLAALPLFYCGLHFFPPIGRI